MLGNWRKAATGQNPPAGHGQSCHWSRGLLFAPLPERMSTMMTGRKHRETQASRSKATHVCVVRKMAHSWAGTRIACARDTHQWYTRQWCSAHGEFRSSRARITMPQRENILSSEIHASVVTRSKMPWHQSRQEYSRCARHRSMSTAGSHAHTTDDGQRSLLSTRCPDRSRGSCCGLGDAASACAHTACCLPPSPCIVSRCCSRRDLVTAPPTLPGSRLSSYVAIDPLTAFCQQRDTASGKVRFRGRLARDHQDEPLLKHMTPAMLNSLRRTDRCLMALRAEEWRATTKAKQHTGVANEARPTQVDSNLATHNKCY